MQYLYLYIIYPIIYIFPAYAANGAPILFGGGKPLDMKAKLNGRRIFGSNKTIRGTAAMLIAGTAVGLIEYPFLHYMLPISFLLALGAVIGDLTGSFIKRRIGISNGASLPVMDQYGFFIFAVLFALPLGHIPDLYGISFLVVLTGIMHVMTNMGAHRLKLKKVPW